MGQSLLVFFRWLVAVSVVCVYIYNKNHSCSKDCSMVLEREG